MEKERDYIGDIAAIRSIMERSVKFLSLSGWAGIMAGIYAIAGAFIAWKLFGLNQSDLMVQNTEIGILPFSIVQIIILFAVVLVLALITAIYDSYRKAQLRNEKVWNQTSKRLIIDMAIPLITGGLIVVVMLIKGFILFIAPVTLIFYGFALLMAGRYTYKEVKGLGCTEIILGLLALWFTEYGLAFWVLGFGLAHIIYGSIMHLKYKK